MSVCSQTGVWEQERKAFYFTELSPLVPKLKFENAMTFETPFPVKKQVNCNNTRNRVSGVSVFPNRSLGTRETFPPRSQTEVLERNDV